MRHVTTLLLLLASPAFALDVPAEDSVEDTPVSAPVTYDIADDDVEGQLLRPSAVRWALDADTTLLLVEDHRVPLVELRLQFPAGSYSPWFEAKHLDEAWTLSFYDPEGELRGRADALAADVSLWVGDEGSGLSVSCLKRDLPEVLELVRDILANEAYDAKELKRAQQGLDIALESQEKDPQFRSYQAAAFALFAEGDPRRAEYEEPDKISKDKEALAAARDVLVRLPGRAIGFAGDLTREEVEALAVGLLPEAGEAPADLAPVYLPLLTDRPESIDEPMDNLTQVYFTTFREGLTWSDPDYASWMVANHVLGGHFFSRLYVALRHEGGETYGARAFMSPSSEPEGYGAGTFTRADNVETTEEKLRDTMATFHADGITEQELAEAVGFFQGRQLFDAEAPGQVLDDALWELREGLEPGFDAAMVEAAAALDVATVNAFIQRFYDPSAFTMLKVVPKD